MVGEVRRNEVRSGNIQYGNILARKIWNGAVCWNDVQNSAVLAWKVLNGVVLAWKIWNSAVCRRALFIVSAMRSFIDDARLPDCLIIGIALSFAPDNGITKLMDLAEDGPPHSSPSKPSSSISLHVL